MLGGSETEKGGRPSSTILKFSSVGAVVAQSYHDHDPPVAAFSAANFALYFLVGLRFLGRLFFAHPLFLFIELRFLCCFASVLFPPVSYRRY